LFSVLRPKKAKSTFNPVSNEFRFTIKILISFDCIILILTIFQIEKEDEATWGDLRDPTIWSELRGATHIIQYKKINKKITIQ